MICEEKLKVAVKLTITNGQKNKTKQQQHPAVWEDTAAASGDRRLAPG